MKEVQGKFLTMRKPQSFVVYPRPTNVGEDYNLIKVQSDKAIGIFDRDTGEGLLNYKGSNAKYGVHLSPQLGAVPFKFPADFVAECLKVQPKKGDREAGGVLIIG